MATYEEYLQQSGMDPSQAAYLALRDRRGGDINLPGAQQAYGAQLQTGVDPSQAAYLAQTQLQQQAPQQQPQQQPQPTPQYQAQQQQAAVHQPAQPSPMQSYVNAAMTGGGFPNPNQQQQPAQQGGQSSPFGQQSGGQRFGGRFGGGFGGGFGGRFGGGFGGGFGGFNPYAMGQYYGNGYGRPAQQPMQQPYRPFMQSQLGGFNPYQSYGQQYGGQQYGASSSSYGGMGGSGGYPGRAMPTGQSSMFSSPMRGLLW